MDGTVDLVAVVVFTRATTAFDLWKFDEELKRIRDLLVHFFLSCRYTRIEIIHINSIGTG